MVDNSPKWLSHGVSKLSMVTSTLLLPFMISVICLLFPKTIQLKFIPLHSVVECMGALISLSVAFLLSKKSSRQANGITEAESGWIISALIAMGLFDVMHAIVDPGNHFVWFHSLSIFTGGLLFSAIWFNHAIYWRGRIAPLFVSIIVLSVCVFSFIYPNDIPTMLLKGRFSESARILNVLGSLGYLAGSFYFLKRSLTDRHPAMLVLSSHCAFFCWSGILFEFSALWDVAWWWWHLLRLFAYVVLIYFIYLPLKQIETLSRVLLKHEAEKIADLVKGAKEGMREALQFLMPLMEYMKVYICEWEKDNKKVWSQFEKTGAGFKKEHIKDKHLIEKLDSLSSKINYQGDEKIAETLSHQTFDKSWRKIKGFNFKYYMIIPLFIFGKLNTLIVLPFKDKQLSERNNTRFFFETLKVALSNKEERKKLKEVVSFDNKFDIDVNLIPKAVLFQTSVIKVLQRSKTIETFVLELIKTMLQVFDFQMGHFYVYSLGSNKLKSSGISYSLKPKAFETLILEHKALSIEMGKELAGEAWEEDSCLYKTDLNKKVLEQREESTAAVEGLAFPISIEERLIGVFEFYSDKALKLREEEIQFFNSFSTYIANFVNLYQKNRDFELILANAGEGIYGLDLEGNATFVNPAACRILGYKKEEIIGKSMHETVHHSHPDGSVYQTEKCPVYIALTKGETSKVDDEVLWHRDGYGIPVRYTATPIFENKMIQGAVVNFIDITKEVKAREDLKKLAHYDSLSRLPNRYSFNGELLRRIHQAERKSCQFAVMFIDLDNFKNVNDSHGHAIGDELLVQAALRLKNTLREGDYLARFGGDEFAVITTELESHRLIGFIASKMSKVFQEPFHIQSLKLYTSLSIGISIYPHGGKDADTLLKHSDIAMYRAKSKGKGDFAIFTEALNNEVKRSQEIDYHLSNAIDKQELSLCYQPIIDIKTNQVICIEALIRWSNSYLNDPVPDEFIPIAELSNLIEKIGLWVIETAFSDYLEILSKTKRDDFGLAINISSKQILAKDFVWLISKKLNESKVKPHLLTIELTENSLMEDLDTNSKILRELSDLGVKVAIDDFGKGYSSMLYLKHLPLDFIKIDKGFVGELETKASDKAIVAGIISLSKRLGLRTIVEGVETKAQYDFIQHEGADAVQGFLLSKPLKIKALVSYILSKAHDSE